MIFFKYRSYVLLLCFKSLTDSPLVGNQVHINFFWNKQDPNLSIQSHLLLLNTVVPDFKLMNNKNTLFSKFMF